MEQEVSFTELFNAYKSNFSIKMMSDEQCENLQKLHERKGSNSGISLSQSDFWMMQAGLVKKKLLSLTETGIVFSKFRSFTLSEEEFLKFLERLTVEKKIDLEEFKTKLLEAGLPSTTSKFPQPMEDVENQSNDHVENQLVLEEPENLVS